jgi:NhaP-type Na+/H+ or K+/H+ antiporter
MTLGGVALGYSVALKIDVSGPIAMVVAFSILVQGSTIAKLFKPAYLKGLLK